MLALIQLHLTAGEIQLSPGWNLVTVPLTESKVNIKDYLDKNLTQGTIQKIWTYDGGWSYYSTTSSDAYIAYAQEIGLNIITEFKQNRGYWFLMGSEGGKLTYSDETSVQGVSFKDRGWALASFNQSNDLASNSDVFLQENIKSDHELGNIAKVWGFSDKGWQFYSPGNASGDLDILGRGLGFWFLLKIPLNLILMKTYK